MKTPISAPKTVMLNTRAVTKVAVDALLASSMPDEELDDLDYSRQ